MLDCLDIIIFLGLNVLLKQRGTKINLKTNMRTKLDGYQKKKRNIGPENQRKGASAFMSNMNV